MTHKVFFILTCFILVLSFNGFSQSIDELLRLAREDSLPEVREAASLALGELWVNSEQTNDQLEKMALEDVSMEVRSAAANALGVRLAQATDDQDTLLNLVLMENFPEVQNQAARTLSERLLFDETQTIESLIELASGNEDERVQNAIIPALSDRLANASLSLAALSEQIISSDTAAQKAAFAQALITRLKNSSIYTLEDDALFDLVNGVDVSVNGAVVGENDALKNAFGQLYQIQLQQSRLRLNGIIRLADDPDEAVDVRKAAGAVLAERFLNANLSLNELEDLARGQTPELRGAVNDALIQAIVGALGRLELQLNELAASVAVSETLELARARAEGVFVLLRTTLIRLDAQADLEALANGETITVNGLILDGSVEAYRLAASDFLTGIYSFFGLIDRFENPLTDLTALAEDSSLTHEFRTAAANALVIIYQAEQVRSQQTVDTLFGLLDAFDQNLSAGELESAIESLNQFSSLLDAQRETIILTSEAGGDFTARQTLNNEVNRSITTIEQAIENASLITIRSELALVRRNLRSVEQNIEQAPDIGDDQLLQIIRSGATSEIQQAASQALSQRWVRHPLPLDSLIGFSIDRIEWVRQAAVAALTDVLKAENMSLDQLYRQALRGETFELRLANAQALLPQFDEVDLEQTQTLASGGFVELEAFLLEANPVQVQQAASQVLRGVFLDENSFSLDDLINFSVDGENLLLQQSAASALSQRWIESTLSEGELFVIASERTLLFGSRPGSSEALSHALSLALANRFLINMPAPADSGEPISISSF